MPNEEFRQTLQRLGIQETDELKRYQQKEQWLQKQQQSIYLQIDRLYTAMTNVISNHSPNGPDPEKESLLAAFQKKARLLHNQYHCVYAEKQYFLRKRIDEEFRPYQTKVGLKDNSLFRRVARRFFLFCGVCKGNVIYRL